MATLKSGPALQQMSCLAVVQRSISELRPEARNPRKHGDKQIAQIAKSIEAFGFNVPVVIDTSDRIIAGHARVLACQKLGWSEVPTLCLSHLSAAQAKAYMIADNRLAETAEWDDELLAETLGELSAMELHFSFEAIGFDMGEVDVRIENASATTSRKAQRAAKAEAQPASTTGPAVARLGDVWVLGQHRVVCGSALDEMAYGKLMDGTKAAMVFVDPPYNVPIEGHVSGLGAVTHREFAMASGEMDRADFVAFLRAALGHHARHSVDGSMHFVCMDWRHMSELLEAGQSTYTELKNLCVWTKDNGGMGSLYRSQHELVFVYKHGTASHCNNVQLGRHGRNRTNVWAYPGANSFAGRGGDNNPLSLHPTVKPVQLVADAILDCSNRGDFVLDGFLGSGTTLIAADGVGRTCLGIELDPLYVDTAIRRWQTLAGGAARHLETGMTFDERQTQTTVGDVS